jgi:hypothetical protein
MTWANCRWHWTAGAHLIQADPLDVNVRTASKYDDSRLLHLPALRMSVRLNWRCIADDHYAVSACAPDRVPVMSDGGEHDSYKAFRSSTVDVAWNWEIAPTTAGGGVESAAEMLLYSNTLRWLSALQSTISAPHRPVRRGSVFGEGALRERKQQLSRHYRCVRAFVA